MNAIFSPCRRYRYLLDRHLRDATPAGRLLVVMLNPSTADETKNDPTVRRVIQFATDWGHDSVRVLNIFALRSTDPFVLRTHADPIGPENDATIATQLRIAARQGSTVLAAWGTHGTLGARGFKVRHMVEGVRWVCLGTNADGTPKHPLYIRANTKPMEF